MPPGENPAEHANTERGARVRVVIDRGTMSEPGMLAEIVDSLSHGAEIRVAAELLMKLVLADADQAVASQLDLSLRTVQRRLRHLMDLAGADSRLQLGWHAARHGWC